MARTICRLMWGALVVVAMNAGEIKREAGGVIVRATDAATEGDLARVEIQSMGGGVVTIPLDYRSVLVRDVQFVGPNRVVVHGKRREDRNDFMTVIDTQSHRIIDTFRGRDMALSPDRRTAAYEAWSPHGAGQVVFWPALVVYDLTAPREVNAPPKARNDPAERGVVLYPERHRMMQQHSVMLPKEEGEMRGGRPRYGLLSPIAWSPDSKRLAVVDHEDEVNRLVIVDISMGLRQPSILTVPIARETFLQPQFGNAIPGEYADSYVAFQESCFSDDGQSVVFKSWGFGPFAEKTVIIAVPRANQ